MTEIITVLSSDVSILSSIAVSRLMPVYDLSTMSVSADQYKLLISEPCEDTSTKHISKFAPLGDIISIIRKQFNVDGISSDVHDLSSNKSDRREVEIGDRGGWFICETQRNPYIISSIYETNNGNISALGGYDLSLGMNEAFKNSVFDIIKAKELTANTIETKELTVEDKLTAKTIDCTEKLTAKTIDCTEKLTAKTIDCTEKLTAKTIDCTEITIDGGPFNPTGGDDKISKLEERISNLEKIIEALQKATLIRVEGSMV